MSPYPRAAAFVTALLVGLIGFTQQSCLLTIALWSGDTSTTRETRKIIAGENGSARAVADGERTVSFAFTTQEGVAKHLPAAWDGLPVDEIHAALVDPLIDSVASISVADERRAGIDDCEIAVELRVKPLERMSHPLVDDPSWSWIAGDDLHGDEPDWKPVREALRATGPLVANYLERGQVQNEPRVEFRIVDGDGRSWDGIGDLPATGSIAIRISPVSGAWEPMVLAMDLPPHAFSRAIAAAAAPEAEWLFGGQCHRSWRGRLDHPLGSTPGEANDVRGLVELAKPAAFSWTLAENGTKRSVGAYVGNTFRVIFTPVAVAADIVLIPVYLVVIIVVAAGGG